MKMFNKRKRYVINEEKLREKFNRTSNAMNDVDYMLADLQGDLEVTVINKHLAHCKGGWIVMADECDLVESKSPRRKKGLALI